MKAFTVVKLDSGAEKIHLASLFTVVFTVGKVPSNPHILNQQAKHNNFAKIPPVSDIFYPSVIKLHFPWWMVTFG